MLCQFRRCTDVPTHFSYLPSKKVFGMGVRGRQSVASLSIVGVSSVERFERAQPPHELTPEQADEWRAVVERMPAEWFPRETHAMLAQYCRHVVRANRVAQLVARCEGNDEFDLKEYDTLLKMQERESRCIASLATRMRITQQTVYDKSKKRGSSISKKPWE